MQSVSLSQFSSGILKRALFVLAALAFLPPALAAQYGIQPVPTPQLNSASINTKGQVAGIAVMDDRPVLLIWLPAADYGLESGVHSYPIPAEVNGASFPGGGQVLDFADNGTVLIGSGRLGSMYFYQGEFVALYGWSTERPDLYVPFNMSNSGIIYTFVGQYPNPAGLVVNGIRTEGPGVSAQEYVGRTLRINPPGILDDLTEAELLGKGNSHGIHISQNWITDWDADVFERRISGIWDNGFIPLEMPGDHPFGGYLDINDKNQLVGSRGTQGYYYLPSGDYGKGLGFHELPFPGENMPAFNQLTAHGELYVQRGRSFFSIPENQLYLLSTMLGTSDFNLNSILRINDAGQVLVNGSEPDGTPRTFVLEAAITATVKVEPTKVELGETFNLNVRIKNNTDLPFGLAGVFGESFRVLGSAAGGLEQLNNPSATTFLPAGETFTQVFPWKSSTSGKVRFSLQALGVQQSGAEFLTPVVLSNEILVKPSGDLLINHGGASEENWLGKDIFQDFPIHPQYLESVMGLVDATAFNLRVENRAEGTKVYSLKASETIGDGWNITYENFHADGNTDITTPIKSGSGSIFEMPGPSVLDIFILVESTKAATAEQKDILITLTDTDTPEETIDAVQFVVKRSEITVEVNPRYPLVGHKAAVSVKFRNVTGETLTEIKPQFIVAETSTFAGGAKVELLTEEPTPQMVASLADGEEATFVYEYRMKGEGKVDFESDVIAKKGDGSQFESALGESARIDVGAITLEYFDLVQALVDVRLVANKGVAMLTTISNTSPEQQTVTYEKTITVNGETERSQGGILNFLPGSSSDIFSTHELDEYRELSPEGGEAEFVLFGDDESVEDYPGRSEKVSYQPVLTYPLTVVFLSLSFPSEYQIPPVPIEVAQAIRSNHGTFINQAFPLPQTEILPLEESELEIETGDQSSEVEIKFVDLLKEAETLAIMEGIDHLVVIFPVHEDTWFVSEEGFYARGFSSTSFKHASAILGDIELANSSPSISASGILNALGFPETPGSTPLIETGFKIYGDGVEILEEVPDLMQERHSPDAWINEDQYEALIDILSQPTLDPEVLIVSGYINQSDEVVADAWYSGLTDIVTQPRNDGAYSVKLMDDQDSVIIEHRFNSNFEIKAKFAASSAGGSTISTDISPFVFSLLRPPELAKVEITKAEQVLYERAVTPNNPVIETLTALAGNTLQPAASQTIGWTATDADGGELEATISWSADGGNRWSPVLFGSSATSYDWTVPNQSTRTGYIRLRVTDGINTTVRDEGPFTIEGSEPAVMIIPGGDLMVTAGKSIELDGSGSYATDDRNLSYHWQALGWPDGGVPEIKNGDQPLATWTPVAEGEYLFKFEATDDDGNTTSSYKRVTVSGSILLRNDSLEITPLPDGRIQLRWAANLLVNLEQSGDLSPETWGLLEAASEIEGEHRVVSMTIPEFMKFFRLRIIEEE